MPDPLTHASPYVVTAITAVAAYASGLPWGVLICAAGGAYWAAYRAGKFTTFWRSALLIISGMLIGWIMVELAVWLVKLLFNIDDLPHRPLAFILGFATIDKPFRDWLISIIKPKFDSHHNGVTDSLKDRK